MRFHINPETGNVSPCRAVAGKCPFSEQTPHFLTAQAAQEAYEKFMQNPSPDESFNSREVDISYTPEAALKKFNEEIKDKEFSLNIFHGGEPGALLETLFGKDPRDNTPGADLGITELKTQSAAMSGSRLTLGRIPSGSNLNRLHGKFLSDKPRTVLNLAVGKWKERGDKKYGLEVDETSRTVSLVVTDEEGNRLTSDREFSWPLATLESKAEEKLKNIAVARYKKENLDTHGANKVTFTEMRIGGITGKTMIEKLKVGRIYFDIKITPESHRVTLSCKLADIEK